ALIYSTTLFDVDIILAILFVVQALAGIGWGLSGPAAQALLADSIESGDRSRIFANMHFLSFVAAAIGPFLAAGLTLVFGNTWGLETLKNLILIGAIGTILSYVSIAFASDDKALISTIEQTSAPSSPIPDTENKIEDFPITMLFGRSFSYDVIIPIIIVISGIIIGFGAGATVAFFPILFTSPDPSIGYGLQPFITYVIFGVTNIISGITGIFAQRIIPIFGRIGSMFLSQGFAIICLLGLVVNLVLYQNNNISLDVSIALLVMLYISRNALMNASSPISRSIVMDVVPSKSRAKWNSLETLAWGMFWSLSSSLGGFIVDNFGFLYVFLFTATLYTIATLMLLLIKNRVPKESILTREYQLGKLRTRNRVVMSAVLNGELRAADSVSGQITTEAITYYAETAKGGTGLIYLSPAYISLSAKERTHQIGIHDDYTIPRLRDAVNECHKYGSLIGIRLAHPGSSALKFAGSEIEEPKTMSIKTINKVIDDFTCAAMRASLAGFDIVEISSCFAHHPDLFTEFLSPKYNTRKDEYGSSFQNRIKFPIEVIKAIRQVLPDSVMFSYYLSVPPHGLSDEIIGYIQKLGEIGVELLSLDFISQSTSNPKVVKQILQLRNEIPSLPLILNGGFDVKSAESILKKGQADFIGFGQLIEQDKSFPLALR
ncbi:MAG: MFS transporter, partial [Candidatus Heimdallarchaeaceae archaeon]